MHHIVLLDVRSCDIAQQTNVYTYTYTYTYAHAHTHSGYVAKINIP